MGWKASLIIIENPENNRDENTILHAIGKANYVFDSEAYLVDSFCPRDNSIIIGYYNGNIIIGDDYQITTNALERARDLTLIKEEKQLVTLFPNSEIISVACNSFVNYHGYSLIKNGVKRRLKTISSETPVIQFGDRIEEEIKLYKTSFSKDNAHYWKDDHDPEEDLSEDQLMEDFTFEIAKRRLGVLLHFGDGEELMEKTVFRKYINPNPGKDDSLNHKKRATWIKYGIFVLLFLLWQILKRTVFK